MDKVQFRFTKKNKLLFYLKYALSKSLLLPFEVKNDRIEILLFELRYALGKIVKKPLEANYKNSFKTVRTINGSFEIKRSPLDLVCVLPSFERADTDYLKKILRDNDNDETLFIDVGADIGFYSILVSKYSNNINTIAFEPSRETYDIFNKNVNLNNFKDRISTENYGLGNSKKELKLYKNTDNPGNNSLISTNLDGDYEKVRIVKLDSYSTNLKKYKTLIMKIDVEGYEEQVLRGAKNLLVGKEVILMVEDFVDASIIDYPQDYKSLNFVKKISPYNSWWMNQYE